MRPSSNTTGVSSFSCSRLEKSSRTSNRNWIFEEFDCPDIFNALCLLCIGNTKHWKCIHSCLHIHIHSCLFSKFMLMSGRLILKRIAQNVYLVWNSMKVLLANWKPTWNTTQLLGAWPLMSYISYQKSKYCKQKGSNKTVVISLSPQHWLFSASVSFIFVV